MVSEKETIPTLSNQYQLLECHIGQLWAVCCHEACCMIGIPVYTISSLYGSTKSNKTYQNVRHATF